MDHIAKSLAVTVRNIEIVGADPATRFGFTQVPNFLLTDKKLSVGAKLAYAMLLKYAWTDDACFPGQQCQSARNFDPGSAFNFDPSSA